MILIQGLYHVSLGYFRLSIVIDWKVFKKLDTYHYLNIICASCGLLDGTNIWSRFTQHLPVSWGLITAEESLIIWRTHLRKSLPFRNFLKHMRRFSNKNSFSEGFPFFRWPHPARESAALLGCQRTTLEGNPRWMWPSIRKNTWIESTKATFCEALSLSFRNPFSLFLLETYEFIASVTTFDEVLWIPNISWHALGAGTTWVAENLFGHATAIWDPWFLPFVGHGHLLELSSRVQPFSCRWFWQISFSKILMPFEKVSSGSWLILVNPKGLDGKPSDCVFVR